MSLLLGGGGLMRGIKIPQQEFALKECGGGDVLSGHYGNTVSSNIHLVYRKYPSSTSVVYKECPSSCSSVQGVSKLAHMLCTNWACICVHFQAVPSICEPVSFQVAIGHSNFYSDDSVCHCIPT